MPKPRARNISGSARSPSAPTASCWRRWSTTTGRNGSSWSSAISPPARISRPSPTSGSASRCGRSDSAGPGLHRGQRPVAQLPRPLSPDRRRSGRGGDAVRGDGRHRAFRSASTEPPTDSLIVISTGNNSSTEVRVRPGADDPTAPLTLVRRARAPTSNMKSTPRTGDCGSWPTTPTSISASPTADPAAPERMARGDRSRRPDLFCAGSPRTATIC